MHISFVNIQGLFRGSISVVNLPQCQGGKLSEGSLLKQRGSEGTLSLPPMKNEGESKEERREFAIKVNIPNSCTIILPP